MLMRESANDHLLEEIYSAQQTNKHGSANSARAGYRDVVPKKWKLK
jgi:hypothetical protein